MSGGIVPVVALALLDPAGCVLMQKRRSGSDFGGLWEFPGGKIEAGETSVSALLREIDEELGITLEAANLFPVATSGDPRGQSGHVIELFGCRSWQGTPKCLAGEEMGWFAVSALSGLEMPPLDIPLAEALAQML